MTEKRGARILIADDDPVIRQLLQVNLRIAGFEVEAVASGHRAVERVTADPPDALILDLMMPGMDGWEVCRLLRADPRSATLPVVVLTARLWDQERELGTLHGVAGFVAKPFDPDDVVTAVRRAIDGVAQAAAP